MFFCKDLRFPEASSGRDRPGVKIEFFSHASVVQKNAVVVDDDSN